jgi:hypothetical protein
VNSTTEYENAIADADVDERNGKPRENEWTKKARKQRFFWLFLLRD